MWNEIQNAATTTIEKLTPYNPNSDPERLASGLNASRCGYCSASHWGFSVHRPFQQFSLWYLIYLLILLFREHVNVCLKIISKLKAYNLSESFLPLVSRWLFGEFNLWPYILSSLCLLSICILGLLYYLCNPSLFKLMYVMQFWFL